MNMKKMIALLLIAVTLMGLLPGCGTTDNSAYIATGDALFREGDDLEEYLSLGEEEIDELTLGYYPDRSMNPLIAATYTNRVLLSLIYQGLFAVDNNYNPTPILCSRYQVSADNTVWTFYVEIGATFSDGSPVTVNDVYASYEKARATDYYKGRFTHVNTIALSDDGGITFTLAHPYQNLPLLLDVPIVKAAELDAEFPLGSGPYTFEKEGESTALLRRNENWWCGKTKIATNAPVIQLVDAQNPSSLRDEFEFGQVSLACTDPCTDSYAEYRCDYELWDCENGIFLFLACNVTYSDFFEDGKLRQIMTYAIDREAIVKKNYNGLAQPATLPASPSFPYYNDALAERFAYDPMKFIDGLSEVNIPIDKETKQKKKMRLLVNVDDSARLRTARELADHLTELGLDCGTLEYGSTTNPTYQTVLQANNWDICLGQTRLSANMDLSGFFAPWGSLYMSGITNGDIQEYNLMALENSGNYYNLHQKVAEHGSVVPVLFGNYAVYAHRGTLTNLSPSRDNIFYYSLGKTMDGIRLGTVYE